MDVFTYSRKKFFPSTFEYTETDILDKYELKYIGVPTINKRICFINTPFCN